MSDDNNQLTTIMFIAARPKIGHSMHREWIISSPQLPTLRIEDQALCKALRKAAKYIERRSVAQLLNMAEGALDTTSYIKDAIFRR